MKILRTLALTLALASASVQAGERQALETYVSPAPTLMPVAIDHAKDLGLSDDQKAKLEAWIASGRADRERMEREIVADRKAINQAMIDGKGNADIQKMVRDVQRKEIKLVVAKLACRDYTRKVLTPEQWKKVIELYLAK
ncbi:MAG: Spy/CpxP family protein refolding chaperone [Gammaproteobacteria bacterium]|jgi:Spy/CpxP family protein refolding chaperone